MQTKKRKRARTRRREAARKARGSGQRAHLITPIPGTPGPAHDGLYDDCPICRALRDSGLAPESGVVEMSEAQRHTFQARLDDIIATEGWPEDARVMGDGSEFGPRFENTMSILTAEGWPDDPFDLADDEREAFFSRFAELMELPVVGN